MRSLLVAGVLALGLVAASATVAEARPASRGIYAEGGFGATRFLGRGRLYSSTGPTMDIRAGYDLWSWLSLGIHLGASSHEATVPPPPEGEWYQLYQGGADGRMGFRVKGVGFFAEGGLGLAYISSNVLGKVMITDPGERFSPVFRAGGGFEYQIENRHYGFGIAGDWTLLPKFGSTLDPLSSVGVRVYLRYTAD
jgi:hypothetical protein